MMSTVAFTSLTANIRWSACQKVTLSPVASAVSLRADVFLLQKIPPGEPGGGGGGRRAEELLIRPGATGERCISRPAGGKF